MNARRRLIVVACLAVAGLALVVASYRALPGSQAPLPTSEPDVAPRPSPTWAPMPTRAVPDAPPHVADLLPLRRALLIGDVASAQLMWDELQAAGAAETYETQLAGARLALQRQAYPAAEERAWHAIGLSPEDAEGWSLLGIALSRAGNTANAASALAIAESLDPSLAPELFDDRWRAAIAMDDGDRLLQLAEGYLVHQPDSSLASHYLGTALLKNGDALMAIDVLVTALRDQPAAPALIWYTLGEAYIAEGGYAEAAVVLEVAAAKVAQGDTTPAYVTSDPITAINRHLAHAYLLTERCAEAEDLFRRLLPTHPDLEALIERAVVCQIPTPTLTPWILPPVTLTPSY